MRASRYTAREIAAATGVCLETVRRWLRDGKLPAIREGRYVYVPETAMRTVIALAANRAGKRNAA